MNAITKSYLFTTFLILGLLSSCENKQLKIHRLRCEYVSSPIAIDNPNPLLSWELQSELRNTKQTAYRILVASDPSLLHEKKADYWDSGKTISGHSVQIKYEGKSLSSRQTVYWKVMVWDENDQALPWSETASWSMGLLQPDDWKGQWIADRTDLYPDATLTFPAPYFRKEFAVSKPVRQAKAYISGLGFYEMYLNGRKVGDQVLAPAVTNYDKREIQKILYYYGDQSTQRVLYNTFDITQLLQQAQNTVGVILGNGWYNQRDRTIEGCMWYSTPRLLLQLEIEYADGSTETIATDQSWKCTTGPLLHDAIFTGEVYDARLELGHWHTNDYDDSQWNPAMAVRAPSGKLQAQLAPFDEITRTINPVFEGLKPAPGKTGPASGGKNPTAEEKANDSVYVYSLPEVVSGWAALSVKGKAGDSIRLRFVGEENIDFGQFDTYILKGEGEGESKGKDENLETWEPRFTWHTFRYIEVMSPHVELNETSLTIKVAHTNPARNGSFTCSNELFNKLYDAYIRTQDANFHGSISSDCPHRERLAYTGDAQVVVESSILSYDMTQFYRKWFDDMYDAQNKVSGYVPHTAPFGGGGGGPAWGSAYVIMPWYYYLYYGDTELLRTHYNGMKHWVAYVGTRTDERGIVVREEPDGWCLGDWCTPGKVEIPEPFVNTSYYYYCTDLLAKIAVALNEKEDVAYYQSLSQQIKDQFNNVYFNPETGIYWEGRQGANVFPLAFGMTPEGTEKIVFEALLHHLEQTDYHFDTGILATPLLLTVLSKNNRTDIAYRIMNQRTAPGFSYLLDDKYTGLWETWNGRSSRCHPMFGSVVAWFYNTLAGIRPDETTPGMKHFIIAPEPTADLTSCQASYQSVYGRIRSEWQKTDGQFRLTVEIPSNTTATIHLPNLSQQQVYESAKPLTETNGITDKGYANGTSILEIGPGTYIFEVR